MKLSEVRALLTAHDYPTTAELDRVDVKRAAGAVIGVDIMFTDGTVAYLPTETG